MFTVDERVTIAQPVAKVFAYLADPRNIPGWRPEVLGIEDCSGPVRLGDQFGEVVSFMGRKTFRMSVTAFEPDRRLVITALTGPVRPVQSFTLEPAGEGATLILHVDVTCLGLFRLLEPVFPPMFRKLWRGYLGNLKNKLSGKGAGDVPRGQA